MEIWKDIPGYEGRYLVSNKGLVKSLVSSHNGRNSATKEYIVKQYFAKGYLRVALTDAMGKVHYFSVHRLVLFAFNSDNTGLHVNHIDGNKQNNNLNNLEWVTRSENQKHAYRIGLEQPVDNGLKKKIAIFKDSVLLSVEDSIRAACRKYNLERREVQRAITGKYKHHHGFTFELL